MRPRRSDAILAETPLCLCLASRRAARAITRAFDGVLKPHGLKPTQFTLLAVLAIKGEQTVGSLARFIGVEKSTMLRNAAVAVREGLVRMRLAAHDARAQCLSITAAGRQRLDGALADWQAKQVALTARLGRDAAAALRGAAARAMEPRA